MSCRRRPSRRRLQDALQRLDPADHVVGVGDRQVDVDHGSCRPARRPRDQPGRVPAQGGSGRRRRSAPRDRAASPSSWLARQQAQLARDVGEVVVVGQQQVRRAVPQPDDGTGAVGRAGDPAGAAITRLAAGVVGSLAPSAKSAQTRVPPGTSSIPQLLASAATMNSPRPVVDSASTSRRSRRVTAASVGVLRGRRLRGDRGVGDGPGRPPRRPRRRRAHRPRAAAARRRSGCCGCAGWRWWPAR